MHNFVQPYIYIYIYIYIFFFSQKAGAKTYKKTGYKGREESKTLVYHNNKIIHLVTFTEQTSVYIAMTMSFQARYTSALYIFVETKKSYCS